MIFGRCSLIMAVLVTTGLAAGCGSTPTDTAQKPAPSTSTSTDAQPPTTTSTVIPAPRGVPDENPAMPEPNSGAGDSPETSLSMKPSPTLALSLAAFEGSGVWIDVYEWSPSATGDSPRVTPGQVADMAAAGMTTLYIQSARTSKNDPVSDPARFREFVDAAHAHNMKAVSWYLPQHLDPVKDLRRVLAPLDYGVDGIGIDVESKDQPDLALRNKRAIKLVRDAADLAGDIPVGAVVFAPQALDRYEPDTWPDFPWAEVAAEADLMVPMAYWTIYAKDFPESVDPVAYTNEALMLLRDRVGPDEPIHSAGGLLQDSGTDEVTAAVEAARQAGVIGVSMYSWSGVKPGQLVSMQEEPR